MIAFIDDHREAHGVAPICKVLPIAPSTYYDHVARRRDPARLSARAKRDMALKVEVRCVFEDNFRVYGVRKVWRQLQREGFDVARCTVERLMREMGLQGVIRGKPIRTTVSDKAAPCPLDKVRSCVKQPSTIYRDSGVNPANLTKPSCATLGNPHRFTREHRNSNATTTRRSQALACRRLSRRARRDGARWL